jgi:periplasmic nitrate reductase NapD
VPEEIHISSLVVHSRPSQAAAVAARLREMPGVEVRGGVEAGKLVVTLETTNESEVVERLNAIQVLDGVLAATLVFHHFEPLQEQG